MLYLEFGVKGKEQEKKISNPKKTPQQQITPNHYSSSKQG